MIVSSSVSQSYIIDCKVSDSTKQEYIYNSDIWELFIKYNVSIPEEEKLVLLYKKYQEMLLVKDISDEKIKKYLDELIESINFKDKSGSIPYEIKEAMLKILYLKADCLFILSPILIAE